MIKARVIRTDDGLIEGEEYEVESVSMGQSYTSICLTTPKEGTKNPFNSVIFNFFEDNKELNIYSDNRFNPYLNILKNKNKCTNKQVV